MTMRTPRVAYVGLWHLLAHFGRRVTRRPESGPRRLRRLFEDLGGTYIKFGQLLALQPDVLSRAYCDALLDLLDRVPPFDFLEVERIFLEDLGRHPEDVFERFERTPLAAATIGQVHRARLDGREVAVKVQRPEAGTVFEADLRSLELIARVIKRLGLRRLDWLVDIIGELAHWTREELDYRHEARFMSMLRYNARDNPREAVPEVVEALTTRRLLVATFLDGPTALDHIRAQEAGGDAALDERLATGGFEPETFARNVISNFVSDAFNYGLFHADLHPANLIILPGNVVGYVDFGIVGTLSRYSRRHITALTLALARADTNAARGHYLRLAHLDETSNVEAFETDLRELMHTWNQGRGGRRMRVRFTQIMLDLLQLSRRTSVMPNPDTIRYLRSVLTTEAVLNRLAPDCDVGGHLEQVCREQLEQDVWRDGLSLPALSDWSGLVLRLVTRGPESFARALPELTGRGRRSNSPERQGLRRRVLQLSAITVATALLATLPAQTPEVGWNVPTAVLALFGSVIAALLWVLT